jgi:uncharacterized protein YdbL (DUF1318 family)
MMRLIRKAFVAATAALVLGTAAPASAIELDQARTQGLVGERPDGLVGAVAANPTPEVHSLVESVNAARLAEYRAIAQKNGSPIEAVQAVAGEKLIQRAKDNRWYVMDQNGRWSR